MAITKSELVLTKSNRTEFGVIRQGNCYTFTCAFDVKKTLELVIEDAAKNVLYNFSIKEYKIAGNVYSVNVEGMQLDSFCYRYVLDGKFINDSYKTSRLGNRAFGVIDESEDKECDSYYIESDYDFSDDKRPLLNQSDVIMYQLHVRGFTKHSSSKVKGKGCFLGIKEKIPYFIELGVNQIELLPAYDFYEFDVSKDYNINHPAYTNDYTLDINGNTVKNKPESKLNYWGYKRANYFCPKYEYSYSSDAVSEFKDMVKALHKAGIEIIMQMFYPRQVKTSEIIESLRFWYMEYHVDGFHVLGDRIPVEQILSDDLLVDAKLYINNLDKNDDQILELSKNRNVIDVNDGFMYSMRRFLKSDNDSLQGFVYSNRLNSPANKTINYITKYEGFTLNDLVSYEHKHNEDNGENNIDGTDYNNSWNCGIEGKSNKKSVKELRVRQIKNALCLLLLSQGTPMLYMGDEFMNTQNGNNNPYCQDNEISWIDWKRNKTSDEIFEFTKEIIEYRKHHKVLHQDIELKNMDYLQCGFPDISYHQDMAWKAELNNYFLHIGIMLEGTYAKTEDIADDTLYLAYNMHWENHEFGLPRLKLGQKWEYVFSSCNSDEIKEIESDLIKAQDEIRIYKRSVVVLKATKKALKEEK